MQNTKNETLQAIYKLSKMRRVHVGLCFPFHIWFMLQVSFGRQEISIEMNNIHDDVPFVDFNNKFYIPHGSGKKLDSVIVISATTQT